MCETFCCSPPSDLDRSYILVCIGSGLGDLQDGTCVQMQNLKKSKPKKEPTKTVSLRLPVSTIETLEALADARGVSRSRVIADLIAGRNLPATNQDRGVLMQILRTLQNLKPILDNEPPEAAALERKLGDIYVILYDMFFSEMRAEGGDDSDDS